MSFWTWVGAIPATLIAWVAYTFMWVAIRRYDERQRANMDAEWDKILHDLDAKQERVRYEVRNHGDQ